MLQLKRMIPIDGNFAVTEPSAEETQRPFAFHIISSLKSFLVTADTALSKVKERTIHERVGGLGGG